LKIEGPSAQKRLPAASKASSLAWALMENKIVPNLTMIRVVNGLFIKFIATREFILSGALLVV
jgi:hypothetical protein